GGASRDRLRGSAEVGKQQSSMRMRIAADAVRTLRGETLARAAFGTFHGSPHLIDCRESKASGEHRGDPFALCLHDWEQAAWRVDESCEEEAPMVRMDDPPVQRKVSAVHRHQR